MHIFIIGICYVENLPPSELKKLRNKQRKAKKKAELDAAQAAQAQVRKEQHNKSRQQQNADGDPEAAPLDELVPDKLARPEDPLERAIDFLRPLQQLAKDCIRTHLLAFEIYYRKNKLLLMLQSIKRAHSIDPTSAQLHACIIKFHRSLLKADAVIDPSVRAVIDKETARLFNNQSAVALNEAFLAKHSDSAAHILQAGRSMYELDAKRKDEAIKLVCNVDLTDVLLEVSFNAKQKWLHSLTRYARIYKSSYN